MSPQKERNVEKELIGYFGNQHEHHISTALLIAEVEVTEEPLAGNLRSAKTIRHCLEIFKTIAPSDLVGIYACILKAKNILEDIGREV